jgi:4-amino-4-deoxy-L-arabinose transferase-like glycosyltransferase
LFFAVNKNIKNNKGYFMNDFVGKLYKVCVMTFCAVLMYFIILATFFRTTLITKIPWFIVVPLVIICVFIIFGIIRFIAKFKLKINKIMLSVLALSVIIPRLLWIIFVDTKPSSDFYLYHQYAVNASKGIFNIFDKTCVVFPHRLGFPMLLSIFYKIFGGYVLTGKLLNVLLSVVTAFLLYWIGEKIFSKNIGFIAAFLFAFWPTQIMYVSVIGSENMFVVFLLSSILMFLKAFETQTKRKGIILYVLSGVLISFAQFIRPQAMLLVPVFFIYCFIVNSDKFNMIKNLVKAVTVTLVIVIAFVAFFSVLCITDYQLNGINMFRSSSGYFMLVGTNYKYNGMYNNEDAQVVREYNWDFNTVHSNAQRLAINRILSNPVQFVKLVQKKNVILWGDDSYGVSWSLSDLSSQNKLSRFFVRNEYILQAISQLYYICILIFSLFGCICIFKDLNKKTNFIIFIFAFNVIAYEFLEIQSRYHYPAVILILIIAALGIKKCTLNIRKSAIL